jgi:hypothetical protein
VVVRISVPARTAVVTVAVAMVWSRSSFITPSSIHASAGVPVRASAQYLPAGDVLRAELNGQSRDDAAQVCPWTIAS